MARHEMPKRSERFLIIACWAVAVIGAGATPARSAEAVRGSPIVLSVDGLAGPRSFTAAEFVALPRARVTWTVHDRTMVCEGPWLTDVLASAGLPSGEAVRGKLLSTTVVATGRDGYRVIFTVGELDHLLGNAPIIVADRCDGAALPGADGPLRLVAAGDKRGARSIRQLVRLSIVATGAEK